MLAKSVEGLNFEYDLYIITLRDHEEKYGYIGKIDRQFKVPPHWIVLDKKTSGQAETVWRGISQEKLNADRQLIIKDCDNYFQTGEIPANCVAICDLMKYPHINATNKSYIRSSATFDGHRIVTEIKEKEIVSSFFCCGLYSFRTVSTFSSAYSITNNSAAYISDLIQTLLSQGYLFSYIEGDNYLDFGTLEDWQKYCKEHSVLLVDIDGIIFENAGEYIFPYWGGAAGITKNITKINQLYESGKQQIILTTARTELYRKITEKQLKDNGVKYHKIVFGLNHGKRIIINDYSTTNPYPSCDAINLARNSATLDQLL